MKNLFYLLAVLMLFSSCSHRIVRTEYKANKSSDEPCYSIIKKNMTISDTLAKLVGEIKLGESGFSVSCSEEHAIRILRNEDCYLGANLIVITDEHRPDAWSSCYRCSAKFYKYNSIEIVNNQKSDDIYKKEYVQERVKSDRGKTAGLILGTIVGLALFFVILM